MKRKPVICQSLLVIPSSIQFQARPVEYNPFDACIKGLSPRNHPELFPPSLPPPLSGGRGGGRREVLRELGGAEGVGLADPIVQ